MIKASYLIAGLLIAIVLISCSFTYVTESERVKVIQSAVNTDDNDVGLMRMNRIEDELEIDLDDDFE